MSDAGEIPCIYVLAGTNGAGKSSIGGAMFREKGVGYFDPDEAARRILAARTDLTQEQANSLAWKEGRRLLERAIVQRLTFAFETTLGGNTIAALLDSAARSGIEVRIWYVGLRTPELHIARVRARVQKGGHDISEDRIRSRYDSGRLNLIHLMPKLTELRVYDNSDDADPHTGAGPEPKLVLHLLEGKVAASCDLALTPEWAKPILVTALKLPTTE